MSQLFLLEFNIKDQAGVDTFMEYMNQSRQRMATDGLEELSNYIDQDDPLHVISLVQWVSREHHDAAMQKEFANPETAKMLAAIGGAQPLRQTWLGKSN
jgi:hypothetical protein